MPYQWEDKIQRNYCYVSECSNRWGFATGHHVSETFLHFHRSDLCINIDTFPGVDLQ